MSIDKAREALTFDYINYRGERSTRRVIPDRVWFGSTSWHPEPQWLLSAVDLDKDSAQRDFALVDMRFTLAPADMRKPEEGEAGRLSPGAEEWLAEADRELLVEEVRDLWAQHRSDERAIAERDRRIAELEAGLEPFARIVDKDGENIVLKWGQSTYSYVLFPKHFYAARVLLTGQDTGGSDG